MDDIDHHSRKSSSRRRNGEKRYNEIVDARDKYLRGFEISSFELDVQEKQMKKVQKLFNDLSVRCPALKQREIVHVKILNGISPKELFVMKTDDTSNANQFRADFQRDYEENNYGLVFCLKSGIFCVAKTRSHGWQRCRILSLHTKNASTVFLLDLGISEHINWIDLRLLGEKWCRQRPFAIRCSLVDCASATAINRCTPLQQQQFALIFQMYENFYISVHRADSLSCDVFLYYVLNNNQFHCVNEIFPSDSSSSTDDDDDDNAEIEELTVSKSRSRTKSTSINRRVAGHTFVMSERSAKQYRTMANECSSVDENQNGVKKDSTMHDIAMKDPSYRVAAAVAAPAAMVPMPLDQQRLSKPQDVIVRHIDETGTVFVCFTKYKNVLDEMRFEIQRQIQVGIDLDGHDLAWNVGDHCLVHGKFDGFTEWIRGKIMHISSTAANDGENAVKVYLRDVGETVETQLHKLRPIQSDTDDSVRNVRDFTWKIRLAHIEINRHAAAGGRIAPILREILDEYDEIAVSLLESKGDQMRAILWGINRSVSVLLPEKIELINVNEVLVNRGYALSCTNFDGINEFVGKFMNVTPEKQRNYSENLQSDSMIQSSYEVNEQRMNVVDWLPSEPIQQREFVAFPMYVNQKCVLSVLEANRRTIADKIKDILEKKYKTDALEYRDTFDWKKDDPCFVRFPADSRFYRGSVRRVNFVDNFCMVRFVDYGNCARCSFDDLRVANMFGDIPVLSRLYQLDNIRSKSEDGLWPDYVREFCGDLVVERQCNVIVTDHLYTTKSPDQPTLCKLEIFTRDRDLATALVTREMADWIGTSSD